MIVQHNISGMNANRQLNITTGLQAKSAEKLSSGYRINRAADDAAGLAISEKMRRQIRGLSQASENTQDGISYVQVADAALAEIDEMLARMNGLCIQAANDTLTPADRQAIDEEIQQLKVEMNRTFHTTSFNEKLIWDEHTTDRKPIGTERRPVYTWSNGTSSYSLPITETNKAAWPNNGQILISADTSGVKLSWTGYDGISYQSNNIAWPSEDQLKTGFEIGLNSTTMDYTTYPGAQGITPRLKLTLDEDADLSMLVSAINGKTVTTSASCSLNGTVQGDSRSSITGNMNYTAGLVSRSSLAGSEDHTDPTNSGANRQNASDTSSISFTYNFNKNSNTEPVTNPNTFLVTAKYSGSVYTSSGERSAATENVWWYKYRGTIYSTNATFSENDFATAISNALNGTASSNNSLIDESSVGGTLHINFNLSTSDSLTWTSSGQTVTGTIGSYTLHMPVNESETAADIITRIANITGADITSSTPSSMTLWNSSYTYFDGNIYAGTMQLNIQAGSESADNNVIPIIYDVLNNHSLKINDLDTLTRENALEGVEKIKVAAQIVDEQRSTFGAYQNRMEHTVKNLDNVVENTQSAESVIRDTDMAAEMVKNSNNNILMQAGQAMLAQANQTNQGVLSLLQ